MASRLKLVLDRMGLCPGERIPYLSDYMEGAVETRSGIEALGVGPKIGALVALESRDQGQS